MNSATLPPKRFVPVGQLILAAVLLTPLTAFGWHAPGHELASKCAASAVAKQLPPFFAAGAATIAHCSVDPDTFTRPIAPKALHDAMAPEHYFDLEMVADLKVPAERYDFIEMLFRKKLKPAAVGLLPFAIDESADKLAICLAEYRRWPNDPAIQAKCLVYAGYLAHYGEDLCQPLHTTIHYDGRVTADNPRPRTGIHMKVDALLGKLHVEPADVAKTLKPIAFDDVMASVMAELKRGNGMVETVYALEKDLPAYEEPLNPDSKAGRFARERLDASAQFTASLFLTAWKRSATIKFPEWHTRPSVPPDQQKFPTATQAE